ncbi:MAG: FmdB family zinc ribbon protein [Candidatus Lustribacter sp.]|jgi:putative FmdB family regulatory protein
MPLYEYQCRSCRKTAEVRHGFKETYDAPCAECGGEMARVFSPAGIVFKGSGFYLTDSRKAAEAAKSGESKASGKSKGSAAPAASSEASSTAAAPAASPAPAASTPAAPAKSESAA